MRTAPPRVAPIAPLQRTGRRLGLAALCVLAGAFTGASALAQQLTNDVKRLVDRHRLADAKIGVVISESANAKPLAEVNPDEALIPASNLKVLTSAAALDLLGPEFQFETTMAKEGSRLIVRGSGDPGLADPELLKEMGIGVEDLLARWVEAVRGAGLKEVTEVVMDDRIFDRQLAHPTWPADQLNRWYCAEVSGLNFHTNILSIFARPGQPERAPSIAIEPKADWIEVQNRAVTKTSGTNRIGATRSPDQNTFTFRGEVRFPSEEPVDVAIHDPALFFGRLLADRLHAAGLGSPKTRVAGPEESLPQGEPIAVIRTPMDVAMRRCNVNSYNLYAECFSKRIGHDLTGQPGSWEGGAAAIRMLIQKRLGPQDAALVTLADGSGMSRNNRISAGVMARWLDSIAADERIGPAFLDSLPTAQKEGSLRARFRSKPVKMDIRAKTGYIRAVSSLSGYVSPPDASHGASRRIIFSILVNDWPSGSSLADVRAFQEDVVMLAHDYLAGQLSRGAAMGGP